ncbi:MAG TPA: sensor histidine kinase [Streptosporangiaceae bacterium]
MAEPAVTGAAGGTSPAKHQGPSRTTQPGSWEMTPLSWDIFYAVVFVVDAVVAQLAPLTATSRIILSAALAAMVVWYLVVGRPQIYGGNGGARSWLYLAGIIALFAVALAQAPNVWFAAFALSPKCFFLLPFRQAMIPIVVFNVLAGALFIASAPSRSGATEALLDIAFSVGLAFVYGQFVDRIVQQSRERADLIGQLEATRAELAIAYREAGTLAERQRLAGEIHDTLAQGFSSIIMLLQAAESGLGPGTPAPARQQVSLAAETARENLAEARGLVAALIPASLASGNLPAALRRITGRLQAETGIGAVFEEDGEPLPLPAALEVVLLRVAQEALANVRKHAAATSARVRLNYAGTTVVLRVSDDGRGFDPGRTTDGYGLRGMRERLDQVHSRVEVTSVPGAGTCVRVEVPL